MKIEGGRLESRGHETGNYRNQTKKIEKARSIIHLKPWVVRTAKETHQLENRAERIKHKKRQNEALFKRQKIAELNSTFTTKKNATELFEKLK